jgi:serine/threonine protein phosphatase PrpC
MAADVFYAMGSSHHVCQDFAVANGDFVILSDGCSSALESDWGARLLVQACKGVMPRLMDFTLLKDTVLKTAKLYTTVLGLHQDCLAATLLCAYKADNNINVFVTGDGYVVAHNKKTDTLSVFAHTFDSGAPYYLYYSLDEALEKSYYESFGLRPFFVDKAVIGKELTTSSAKMTLEEARFVSYSFPMDEYDMVGIASDGLKSFVQQMKTNTSIQNKGVDYLEVLKELIDFKNATGQFVHRRCQRVMREFGMKGMKHTDDFSMGVIHDDPI